MIAQKECLVAAKHAKTVRQQVEEFSASDDHLDLGCAPGNEWWLCWQIVILLDVIHIFVLLLLLLLYLK